MDFMELIELNVASDNIKVINAIEKTLFDKKLIKSSQRYKATTKYLDNNMIIEKKETILKIIMLKALLTSVEPIIKELHNYENPEIFYKILN